MEIIVLLGAPGSGKGTAAKGLQEAEGVTHISTGTLFREAMAAHTEMGEAIRPYMDRGELVPDDWVVVLVEDLIKKSPAGQRVLFDGFPRTLGQAQALEKLVVGAGSALSQVLLLEVEQDALVDRLGARIGCTSCGTIYNLLTRPPKKEGTCDACGSRLSQRNDDHLATIRRRLRIYEERTAPLVAFYEKRGLLRRIDAGKSPDDVIGQICNILRRDPN